MRLDSWYKLLIFVGAVMLASAYLFLDRGFSRAQIQLVGGGLFIIGIAEWHDKRDSARRSTFFEGFIPEKWKKTMEGILIEIIGTALLCLGLWGFTGPLFK